MKNEKLKIKNEKFFLTLFIVHCSLFITLSSCERINGLLGRNNDSTEEAEIPVTVFAVNTTTAVQGQIQDYIALSGDIIASSRLMYFLKLQAG